LVLEGLSNHCSKLSADLEKLTLEKGELADQYLELVSAKNAIEVQLNEKLDAAAEAKLKLHLESKFIGLTSQAYKADRYYRSKLTADGTVESRHQSIHLRIDVED